MHVFIAKFRTLESEHEDQWDQMFHPMWCCGQYIRVFHGNYHIYKIRPNEYKFVISNQHIWAMSESG